MITISEDSPVLTVVSVFTVQPGRQDELVSLLGKNLEWLRSCSGFVSSSLHVSSDGLFVINYAQWESAAALEAALKGPNTREHAAAVSRVATVKAMRCAVTKSVARETA